jgi:hypothetical protein
MRHANGVGSNRSPINLKAKRPTCLSRIADNRAAELCKSTTAAAYASGSKQLVLTSMTYSATELGRAVERHDRVVCGRRDADMKLTSRLQDGPPRAHRDASLQQPMRRYTRRYRCLSCPRVPTDEPDALQPVPAAVASPGTRDMREQIRFGVKRKHTRRYPDGCFSEATGCPSHASASPSACNGRWRGS